MLKSFYIIFVTLLFSFLAGQYSNSPSESKGVILLIEHTTLQEYEQKSEGISELFVQRNSNCRSIESNYRNEEISGNEGEHILRIFTDLNKTRTLSLNHIYSSIKAKRYTNGDYLYLIYHLLI